VFFYVLVHQPHLAHVNTMHVFSGLRFVAVLVYQVKDEFDLPRNGWRIWMNREKSKELIPQKTKTLNSYKVRCAV